MLTSAKNFKRNEITSQPGRLPFPIAGIALNSMC